MAVKELPDFTRLYQAFAAVSDETECASLLEDLCSQTELRAMNQRLEVATLLMSGETFLSIQQQLGVSSAIVARVNRALQHSKGGMRQVIERLDPKE